MDRDPAEPPKRGGRGDWGGVKQAQSRRLAEMTVVQTQMVNPDNKQLHQLPWCRCNDAHISFPFIPRSNPSLPFSLPPQVVQRWQMLFGKGV